MMPHAAAPEVSVIVPTFNEVGNVGPLVEKIAVALNGTHWEVVFVDDDSTDGTLAALHELARRDTRIRLVHRIGRRGLSSAVVEGILSTSAPYVAVMDADLQHDEAILPRMLAELKNGADIVVGSRYTAGGSIGDWNRSRAIASRVATRLATAVVRAELTDPMSGYFAMTRGTFERAVRRLSSQGYKILLDIFASLPSRPRFQEVPYTFRARHSGASKLDALVAWEYIMLVLDKLVGHIVPIRFLLFGLVGGLGIGVHFLTLWLVYRHGYLGFASAQTVATFVAMTFNFFVNNVFTYRDRQMRGWRLLPGLLSFYAVCGIGVVANVGVGSFVFRQRYTWWIAGGAGALVGSVWNYAATSLVTWRGHRAVR
jgi:dolichol-phosphate mannosyltransferase